MVNWRESLIRMRALNEASILVFVGKRITNRSNRSKHSSLLLELDSFLIFSGNPSEIFHLTFARHFHDFCLLL